MTTRVDMPVAFGPSLLPDKSVVEDASVAVVSFITDPAALALLVPALIIPNDPPIITFSRISYSSLEYLGGRGYNEVVVSIPSEFRGGEVIRAGYAPVMWVDQPGALISGREYMGFAKLAGEFSATELGGQRAQFDCHEYGNLLFSATLSDLVPIEPDKLKRINAAAAKVFTLGWKHIAGPGGTVDLDYATVNAVGWHYHEAWSGSGDIEFSLPDSIAAPFSSRIMQSFAALPKVRMLPAFAGRGSVVIDRMATRKLAMSPNVASQHAA